MQTTLRYNACTSAESASSQMTTKQIEKLGEKSMSVRSCPEREFLLDGDTRYLPEITSLGTEKGVH